MRKALIRKQLLQTVRAVTGNPKTGKRRKTGGIILMAFLFVMVWFSMIMAFFGMTEAFAAFFDMGLGWFFFASMALVTLAAGVLMTIFTVISTVYQAKDNELLLSLPIRPKDILFARLFQVWMLAMLFMTMTAVPTLVRWFMRANAGALGNLFAVLIMLLIPLLSVSLASLVGWIVAWISSKLTKAKNFMTVFLTVLFLAAYYVFYFRINTILRDIVAQGPALAEKLSGSWNPLYRVGQAAYGDVLSFLLIAAICVGAFVICYALLSRNFAKIVTTKKSAEKRVYREKAAQQSSRRNALYRKEMKHFLGSPAYMLNGGMGILFMAAAAVLLLIYQETARSAVLTLDAQFPGIGIAKFLPLAGALLIAFMAAANDITAPAISIEAHTLWLSKSMPITAREFLEAKLQLHRVLTYVPTILVAIVFFIVFAGGGNGLPGLDPKDFVLMLAFALLFAEFMGTFGLAANLLMPNMTWTNETVAVKQSYSALIALFGGWIFTGLLGLAFWLLRDTLGPVEFLMAGIVFLAVLVILIRRWLYTRGAKRYEQL